MTAGHDGDEGRRQAYLTALGIPLWSPRRALPGALASQPLEFVPYTATAVAVPAEAMPAPAPEPAAAVTRQAVVTPPPQSAGRQPAEAVPHREMPPATGEKAAFPRVICRVQTLAPGYSAVVTLGDAPDLSAVEHRLLANIAQALGGDVTAIQPCEHLRWPLNRNPAFDHSAGAMIEWLSHALKVRNPRCIVFGEELAGYVRQALPQAAVIAAPVLTALLADPAAKKDFWKALHG